MRLRTPFRTPPASWRIALRALWALPIFCTSAAHGQRLEVEPDRASGVYGAGDPIKLSVKWSGEGAPTTADYILKRGGLVETAKGSLSLAGGAAVMETRLSVPGTLLMEVTATAKDGRKLRAVGGVVVEPRQIAISTPVPYDFNGFWNGKLKELASVPPEPSLEPVDGGKPGVEYWKIRMNHFRGSQIQGQVARPKAGEKLPALLIVQWAGIYPLQKSWVTDRAAEGWLCLNIQAHDLPIDEPASFYQEQASGPLKNYPAIGNDDKETSYFLRMYLSCYRAAEYLTQRPDWDGKTLVVMGGSQGGMQSLVTAALHPKVTAALASVPAGCDLLGPESGRAPGWPMWYRQTEGKDEKKVRSAARYFDVVNFAPRIRCPVLIGVGMIDEVCPPAGILAAANRIRGKKEIVLLPKGAHGNENDSHKPYDDRCWGAWLPALREGKPAPVNARSSPGGGL